MAAVATATQAGRRLRCSAIRTAGLCSNRLAAGDRELIDLKERARAADMTLLDEGETTCCYARSDKYWLTDPQGIAWEQFHTLADIPVFSETQAADTRSPACCADVAPRGRSTDRQRTT